MIKNYSYICLVFYLDLYCFSYHMEAVWEANDSMNSLSYTYKLRPGVTNIDNYGIILARDVKMPENLIDHAIEIEKQLVKTNLVSGSSIYFILCK